MPAIKETIDFIWGTWLPRSEYEPARTSDFERYDDRFDGVTGEGELEIFVPIR